MAEQIGTRSIEHRGRTFEIAPTGPNVWSVTELATGKGYGHLVLVSAQGEEGSPVYGVVLDGHPSPFMDGTDWDDITRALINQVDSGVDV